MKGHVSSHKLKLERKGEKKGGGGSPKTLRNSNRGKGPRRGREGVFWGVILAILCCHIVCTYEHEPTRPISVYNYSAPIKTVGKEKELIRQKLFSNPWPQDIF